MTVRGIRKTWADKLNKAELEHLIMATNNKGTLQAFKRNREEQIDMAIRVTALNPNKPCKEICPECRRIALKLGIEQ